MDEEIRQGNHNSLCGLLGCIEEFGDREFQDRVWLKGLGPEVSSYSEALCGVFDDYRIEDFAGDDGRDCGLTRDQTNALERFARELNNFSKKIESDENSTAIVRHPEFAKIIDLAKETAAVCVLWRNEHCKEWNDGLGQATL